MTKRGELAKAQEYLDAGWELRKTAKKLDITERTLGRWLRDGKLVRPDFMNRAKRQQETPPGPRVETAYEWTEISAADLTKFAFLPATASFIVASLGIARQQKNVRAHRYMKGWLDVSERWPNMPQAWRGILAGFPIIAEDINSPSMKELAELVRELHPYLSKEFRREYHKRVRPILIGILAEVQAFIAYAADTVVPANQERGFPLLIIPGEPRRKPWERRSKEGWVGASEAQDALEKGSWKCLPAKGFPLDNTWAGVLFDIVSRLPDPDRQHGKLMGKRQLSDIIHRWCFTAPGDFAPPLTKIRRSKQLAREAPIATYLHWKGEVKGERGEVKQSWLVGAADSEAKPNKTKEKETRK